MTVVGITVGLTPAEQRNQPRYVEAVLAAGGAPVLLPAVLMSEDQVFESVRGVDALLLSGGGDIHPSLYGARPEGELQEVDLARDAYERQAFLWMLERQRRVLGICRGAQLMAAATGGTLIQDLPTEGHEGHQDRTGGYATMRHGLKIEPGSLIGQLLDGIGEINSHHHQAVRDPGRTLTPTAWATDGVIEALEAPHLLAVQWHPEIGASASNKHLRLFEWLVQGQKGGGCHE